MRNRDRCQLSTVFDPDWFVVLSTIIHFAVGHIFRYKIFMNSRTSLFLFLRVYAPWAYPFPWFVINWMTVSYDTHANAKMAFAENYFTEKENCTKSMLCIRFRHFICDHPNGAGHGHQYTGHKRKMWMKPKIKMRNETKYFRRKCHGRREKGGKSIISIAHPVPFGVLHCSVWIHIFDETQLINVISFFFHEINDGVVTRQLCRHRHKILLFSFHAKRRMWVVLYWRYV